MKAGVKLLLSELLKEKEIVASWGMTKIEILDNKVRFNVQGFLYQGLISISHVDNDQYYILFENNMKHTTNCKLDEIVNYMDSAIEYCADYENKVLNWII